MNETLLDDILAPGGLSVLFQPIFDIRGHAPALHALECLIRGPIGSNLHDPNVLFEYARRKRVENLVDRACVTAAFEAASGMEPETLLSVNVHASTLARDHEFLVFLGDLSNLHSIALERVIVEIGEQTPVFEEASLLNTLRDLRAIGVRIALDDVGLGQSNFRMILDCRPDYLKLDRYFVDGCAADFYRQAILESVTALARRFGARVVAEGVASAPDLARVKSLGIDLVQGHVFAKAMPREALSSDGLMRSSLSVSP